MLKTLSALAAALLTGGAACTAIADPTPGSRERFDMLDRNHDGYVSRDEGKDAEELNTRFSELDANNDGKLSRDEYTGLEREAREAAARNSNGKAAQGATRPSSAAGSAK